MALASGTAGSGSTGPGLCPSHPSLLLCAPPISPPADPSVLLPPKSGSPALLEDPENGACPPKVRPLSQWLKPWGQLSEKIHHKTEKGRPSLREESPGQTKQQLSLINHVF